jgi:integrase
MMWSQFDGEIIEDRQQKTDEYLDIPCNEKLRAEIETMPRLGKTILIGERGHSLTAHSLGVLVSRALRGMGVTGYSIHGLRRNAAKALAEAGCSDTEIMAVTGHRTNEMIRLYTRQAEQRRMARQAMDKLEAPMPARKRFGTEGKFS